MVFRSSTIFLKEENIVLSEVISAAATAAKSLQSCPTLCDPNRRQPTRLLRPQDSPGKSTGVGFHFLLWRLSLPM